MELCLIVTYRCNAKCYMCNTWKNPTRKEEEFRPSLLDKIPCGLNFINITGGEPFLRDDIEDILDVALCKTRRLVISTNGYFSKKIIKVAEKYGNRLGFRISIEGLPATNDELRGISNGFDHGMRSLLALRDMGIKDIGFGITVSDKNAKDLIELWRLSKSMNLEFATATTHNSFYFHKHDNSYRDPEMIAREFERLSVELLRTNKLKNWFRAYFNMGLANKVRGGERFLSCKAGSDILFLDPFGNLLPCNGSDEPMKMGNLHEQSFNDILNGPEASRVLRQVKNCEKQCWMVGSVSPAIKKHPWKALHWIALNQPRVRIARDCEPRLTGVYGQRDLKTS
jgi:Fe-coproporphyrin III synthase